MMALTCLQTLKKKKVRKDRGVSKNKGTPSDLGYISVVGKVIGPPKVKNAL